VAALHNRTRRWALGHPLGWQQRYRCRAQRPVLKEVPVPFCQANGTNGTQWTHGTNRGLGEGCGGRGMRQFAATAKNDTASHYVRRPGHQSICTRKAIATGNDRLHRRREPCIGSASERPLAPDVGEGRPECAH